MSRTSLATLLLLVAAGLPKTGRAADQADPFASPSEAKEPTPTDDEEAAVLGAPNRPAPSAEPPPAPQPAPQRAAPPQPRRPAARRQASDEERSAISAQAAGDQSGFALELSTSGFASGSLAGGLFVGGRTASGLILGGFIDYGLTSMSFGSDPQPTTSTQFFRLGAGLRYTFVESADHLVDLYAAADTSFESRGAEVLTVTQTATATEKLSASGFSLAAGPGLRLWVHDRIAVGYVARFRVTYLSGPVGVFSSPPIDVTVNGSQTQIGFDGTFQVLGVF